MIREIIDAFDRAVEMLEWILKRYVTLILLFVLLFLVALAGYLAGANHW